jgi:uncharacterized protein YjbI with pentapeptide repeats
MPFGSLCGVQVLDLVKATRMKKRNFKILALVFLFILGASQTRAEIDEWEWANINDPSQGVVQSSQACPGGSGASAVPFAALSDRDLTQAYLTYAYLYSANMTRTNLTIANLVSAYLTDATLTDANLTGANLTNAYLYSTMLTGANLTSADLTNAYLGSANLKNATLTGATLTNAYLLGTTLTDANLTGADLRGSQGLALGSANATNAILQTAQSRDYTWTRTTLASSSAIIAATSRSTFSKG